jgi:hypothetical protein
MQGGGLLPFRLRSASRRYLNVLFEPRDQVLKNLKATTLGGWEEYVQCFFTALSSTRWPEMTAESPAAVMRQDWRHLAKTGVPARGLDFSHCGIFKRHFPCKIYQPGRNHLQG